MSLSYTVPSPGSTLNSVADPEVASALNAILSWANGNIQGNDLSPTAQIASSQLAASAQRPLIKAAVSANYTAVAGDLVEVTANNPTITLPTAPPANSLVGVVIANGAVSGYWPVTVQAAAGADIYGVGCYGVSSIPLGTPGASILLQYNGANYWLVVAGQQDTGWVPLSLASGLVAFGAYTPAFRLTGDTVRLRFDVTNSTGSTISTPLATIPAGYRPLQALGPLVSLGGSVEQLGISAAGAITMNIPGNTYLLADNEITWGLS